MQALDWLRVGMLHGPQFRSWIRGASSKRPGPARIANSTSVTPRPQHQLAATAPHCDIEKKVDQRRASCTSVVAALCCHANL